MSYPEQWSHRLDGQALVVHYALIARIDPAFGAAQKAFYEARTVGELKTLAQAAWYANDANGYQLARSYEALAAA